jgi:hypothetical protein
LSSRSSPLALEVIQFQDHSSTASAAGPNPANSLR